MLKKSIDRHKEPEESIFTFRLPSAHLRTVAAVAKDEDRTRGAVVREAIRQWLLRRQK